MVFQKATPQGFQLGEERLGFLYLHRLGGLENYDGKALSGSRRPKTRVMIVHNSRWVICMSLGQVGLKWTLPRILHGTPRQKAKVMSVHNIEWA